MCTALSLLRRAPTRYCDPYGSPCNDCDREGVSKFRQIRGLVDILDVCLRRLVVSRTRDFRTQEIVTVGGYESGRRLPVSQTLVGSAGGEGGLYP